MKQLALPRLALLTVLFLLPASGQAQTGTTLVAGDIAFIGVNATDNTINGTSSDDDVSFVLLKAVNPGTEIYFTDFGWRSDSAKFQRANPCGSGPSGSGSGALTDGIVKWTTTTMLPYGTQVNIRTKLAPSASVGSATGHLAAANTFSGMTQYVSVATSGESLFAYQQSTPGGPITLITGINMSPTGWATSLVNCDFTSTPSVRPTALDTGNTSFALLPTSGNVNMRLNPAIIISNVPSVARGQIANAANWTFSSTAYSLPPGNAVLPVSLVSFSGYRSGNASMLTWEMGEEEGVEGYILEYSIDGTRFSDAGWVAAQSARNYEAQHTPASNSLAYYRLRISERSGKQHFSNVVTLHGDAIGAPASSLRVVPNPAGEIITVRLDVAISGQPLILTDLAGRTVLQQMPASEEVMLSLHALPSGMYLLRHGAEVVRVCRQ